jgi:hypothetical protein
MLNLIAISACDSMAKYKDNTYFVTVIEKKKAITLAIAHAMTANKIFTIRLEEI